MDSPTSEAREIEVNVVSSPESSSRNASPEPENYRLVNRLTPPNTITCYPLIKTSEDTDKNKNCETKSTPTSKTVSSGSTNFSISSILSRSEPSPKKNGYMTVPTGTAQNILESAMGASCTDSAMLSR